MFVHSQLTDHTLDSLVPRDLWPLTCDPASCLHHTLLQLPEQIYSNYTFLRETKWGTVTLRKMRRRKMASGGGACWPIWAAIGWLFHREVEAELWLADRCVKREKSSEQFRKFFFFRSSLNPRYIHWFPWFYCWFYCWFYWFCFSVLLDYLMNLISFPSFLIFFLSVHLLIVLLCVFVSSALFLFFLAYFLLLFFIPFTSCFYFSGSLTSLVFIIIFPSSFEYFDVIVSPLFLPLWSPLPLLLLLLLLFYSSSILCSLIFSSLVSFLFLLFTHSDITFIYISNPSFI